MEWNYTTHHVVHWEEVHIFPYEYDTSVSVCMNCGQCVLWHRQAQNTNLIRQQKSVGKFLNEKLQLTRVELTQREDWRLGTSTSLKSLCSIFPFSSSRRVSKGNFD